MQSQQSNTYAQNADNKSNLPHDAQPISIKSTEQAKANEKKSNTTTQESVFKILFGDHTGFYTALLVIVVGLQVVWIVRQEHWAKVHERAYIIGGGPYGKPEGEREFTDLKKMTIQNYVLLNHHHSDALPGCYSEDWS